MLKIVNKCKEDLSKFTNIPCVWMGRLNIVKMANSTNWSLDSMQSPLKGVLIKEIGKLVLKFIWKCKASRITKIILKEKKERLILPCFKIYDKTLVNHICVALAWGWTWERMEENSESTNKPSNLWSADEWQGVETIQWGENGLFNKWCGDDWISACRKWN